MLTNDKINHDDDDDGDATVAGFPFIADEQ